MHMNIRINIVKIDKMVYNIYRGDIMQIIDQMIAEIVNLFIKQEVPDTIKFL